MTKMLVSVALAAAALAAAPTAAAPLADVDKTTVAYGDLNLGHAEGRAVLDRRIRGAARLVCGVEQAPGLIEHNAVKNCRDATIAAASSEVEKVLAARGGASQVVVAARR